MPDSIRTDPGRSDSITPIRNDFHLLQGPIQHIQQLIGGDIGRQITQIELTIRLTTDQFLLGFHLAQLVHLFRILRYVRLITTLRGAIISKPTMFRICLLFVSTPSVILIILTIFLPVISMSIPLLIRSLPLPIPISVPVLMLLLCLPTPLPLPTTMLLLLLIFLVLRTGSLPVMFLMLMLPLLIWIFMFFLLLLAWRWVLSLLLQIHPLINHQLSNHAI